MGTRSKERLGGFVFQLIITVALKKRLSLKTLPHAVLMGVLIVLGEKCIFMSMDLLRSSGFLYIVYPTAIGVCIIGMALYSGIILKEKFRFTQILGIVLGILGILLVSIK